MRPWSIHTWLSLTTRLPISFSLTCTTTLCPTTSWPLVTWKRSGTHVPPSILVTRALVVGPISISSRETPAVQVQPDQRAKTKEPDFHYTA
ncbi:unnamed protein product [Spirodela intermedia]|uniref:Uncharacterized protein n=1 Tax=Spirodela intermedia TaxID=51605 RepID=A0A7I8KVH5_SPIIN|nr:unnamed protein product [Spirodela intermedia]